MSFLNSLIKGFVRSAVNQVGRDAGRVVSNRTMKGRHAIPHTRVPSSVSMPEKKPDLSWGMSPEALALTSAEKATLNEAFKKLPQVPSLRFAQDKLPSVPSSYRSLTKNQLYAYALQLGANADGEVSAGETSLAARLHTASGRDTLDAAATLIRDDLVKGIHPLQTFNANIARHPEDVRLNALRLMAKLMLQDGRFGPDEQAWFFEAVGAAGVEAGRV
jgi:hypothetical protein